MSNLDEQTAEHFCRTLNQLRNQLDRKVTIVFITHQLPKALQVDGVIRIGGASASTVGAAIGQTLGPAAAGLGA